MKDRREISILVRCGSKLQRMFFLALLCVLSIGSAWAQGKSVSGTVLDKSA